MKILYKNTTAEKQFSPKYQKKWKYPEQVKIKLLSIENAISQATCLRDIAMMPQYRFHSLKGERKHERFPGSAVEGLIPTQMSGFSPRVARI